MSDEKKKILLVDDDEIHLAIAEVILEDTYEVFTAKSGKEALDRLLHGLTPGLILLDIFMPEMDGWETFKRLKAISCLKNVPIAFLTSADGVKEKTYAQQIGAADFISKPLEREDLMNRIEAIMENSYVRR